MEDSGSVGVGDSYAHQQPPEARHGGLDLRVYGDRHKPTEETKKREVLQPQKVWVGQCDIVKREDSVCCHGCCYGLPHCIQRDNLLVQAIQ